MMSAASVGPTFGDVVQVALVAKALCKLPAVVGVGHVREGFLARSRPNTHVDLSSERQRVSACSIKESLLVRVAMARYPR